MAFNLGVVFSFSNFMYCICVLPFQQIFLFSYLNFILLNFSVHVYKQETAIDVANSHSYTIL